MRWIQPLLWLCPSPSAVVCLHLRLGPTLRRLISICGCLGVRASEVLWRDKTAVDLARSNRKQEVLLQLPVYHCLRAMTLLR